MFLLFETALLENLLHV